jgi:hypothetical protein
MDPNHFFYLILPLGVIVFFLVGLVVFYARKEEDNYEKELKNLRRMLLSGKINRKTYVNLSNRLKYAKHFNDESKKLVSLLSDEKIDQGTYNRLRHILETTFRERLEKIDQHTNEPSKEKPFDASKF